MQVTKSDLFFNEFVMNLLASTRVFRTKKLTNFSFLSIFNVPLQT